MTGFEYEERQRPRKDKIVGALQTVGFIAPTPSVRHFQCMGGSHSVQVAEPLDPSANVAALLLGYCSGPTCFQKNFVFGQNQA